MKAALAATEAVASLTPTITSSRASRRRTSVTTLRPVRTGMSYSSTGRPSAASWMARKWASNPVCGGRL